MDGKECSVLDSRQLFARIQSASNTVSVVISRILPITSVQS